MKTIGESLHSRPTNYYSWQVTYYSIFPYARYYFNVQFNVKFRSNSSKLSNIYSIALNRVPSNVTADEIYARPSEWSKSSGKELSLQINCDWCGPGYLCKWSQVAVYGERKSLTKPFLKMLIMILNINYLYIAVTVCYATNKMWDEITNRFPNFNVAIV